ncbi:MAG: hypothetical protein VXY93_16500, partial [Pseudomonadota bacterium]|nr:hypothetical protein [Pseudomonadota bacterium]
DSSSEPFTFHTGNSIQFMTDANIGLKVNSDGKIGINTTNPSKALHVDGTIFASGATTSLDGGLRIQPNNYGTTYGGVIYGGAHNDNNTAIYMRRGQDNALNTIDINSYGMFRVFTNGALASQQERLRIKSDGNVGIATNNPITKLDVRGGSILVDAFNTSGDHGIFFRAGFIPSNNPYNVSILAYDHSGSSKDGLSVNAYDGISFCTGSNTRNERARIDLNGRLLINHT